MRPFQADMRSRYVLCLIVFYGIYLIAGASIFEALEYAREEKMCEKYLEELKQFNLTRSNHFLVNTKELLQVVLGAINNGIIFNSNLIPSCAHNWNFENSFFFAGTVITTIGYGNIAPGSWEGRVFCLFYAAIGLPLFGIMFSEIGSIFAGIFRKLEKFLKKKISNQRLRHCCVLLTLLSTVTVFYLVFPACIFVQVEEWTFHEAFYYSFITLTTIGFGDFVAGVNPDISYMSVYRVAVYFWILFGLAFMAAVIKVISDMIQATANDQLENESRGSEDIKAMELASRKSKPEVNVIHSCSNCNIPMCVVSNNNNEK